MNFQILNPLRWKKSFLVAVLATFLITWFSFLDTYSLWTHYQLKQRKQELKAKTEQLQQQTEELKAKIKDLENDPDLLERIAREEYGMRKKGETVYKIREKE